MPSSKIGDHDRRENQSEMPSAKMRDHDKPKIVIHHHVHHHHHHLEFDLPKFTNEYTRNTYLNINAIDHCLASAIDQLD